MNRRENLGDFEMDTVITKYQLRYYRWSKNLPKQPFLSFPLIIFPKNCNFLERNIGLCYTITIDKWVLGTLLIGRKI